MPIVKHMNIVTTSSAFYTVTKGFKWNQTSWNTSWSTCLVTIMHANCDDDALNIKHMNIVTTKSAFYTVTKVPNNDCAQRNTHGYSHH